MVDTKMTINTMKSTVMFCDWDAVISRIENRWMSNAFENEIFKDDITLSHVLDLVMGRTEYYMYNFLKEQNVFKPGITQNKFDEFYLEDEEFYLHSPILRMAQSINSLLQQDAVKEIHFLSSCRFINHGSKIDNRKEELIPILFPENNSIVHFHAIPPNMKKHEYIIHNMNGISATTFIDDCPDILYDVVNHCYKDTLFTATMPMTNYGLKYLKDNMESINELFKDEEFRFFRCFENPPLLIDENTYLTPYFLKNMVLA